MSSDRLTNKAVWLTEIEKALQKSGLTSNVHFDLLNKKLTAHQVLQKNSKLETGDMCSEERKEGIESEGDTRDKIKG